MYFKLVLQAMLMSSITVDYVHCSGTCNAMKSINVNNTLSRDVLIVKAVFKKIEDNLLRIKVQKEFTNKGLPSSSIDAFSSELIVDACGSELVTESAYVFFLKCMPGSKAKYELVESIYSSTKFILRQIRKIASELEATTLEAVKSTATTVAQQTVAHNSTSSNDTTTVKAITELVGRAFNPMARLCVDNLITCYNGGTCYEIGDKPHCICKSGRKGPQCELFDITLTFESTSTNEVKNHDCHLDELTSTTPSLKTNSKKRDLQVTGTLQANPNPFLDMTEALIALGVILVATVLIIVLGVYLYVKYRKSIRNDRVKRNELARENSHDFENPPNPEIIGMLRTSSDTSTPV